MSLASASYYYKLKSLIYISGVTLIACEQFPWVSEVTRAVGKCHFTIDNVMQYNRNVNLPRVNVSRVKTTSVSFYKIIFYGNKIQP